MSKFLKGLGVFIVVLIIVAAATSGETSNQDNKIADQETTQDAESSREESKKFFIGDVVDMDGLTIEVIGMSDYSEANEFLQPDAGNKYISIEVKIQNISKDPIGYGNQLYFTLKDGEGYSYDTTLIGKEPAMSSDTLNEGEITRGFLTFEVPVNSSNLSLKYEPNLGLAGNVTVQLSPKSE